MYTKDIGKKLYIYSVIISFALCIAQLTGQIAFILLVLIAFLFLSRNAALKDFAFPILMYFLPWASLLKMRPGTISFYTLTLIIVCIFRFHITIKKKYLAIGISIFILTMVSKLIYGLPVSNSYFLFLVLLVFFPVISEETEKNYDFSTVLLFFSTGIIIAALSARYFMSYRNIAKYIVDLSYGQITRSSGYYSDPNFYSAHITAAISGLLLKLYYEKDKKKIYLFSIGIIILLYCGLLSASKSFALVTILIFILWTYKILQEKGNVRVKTTILIAVLFAVWFVSKSDEFKSLINILMMRFVNADTLSGLTTGRSDIWISYLKEFISDMYLLFMGKGYSNILVKGRAPHNTVLQIIYQFGLIGTFFIVLWIKHFVKDTLPYYKNKSIDMKILILLVGVFLPWMALDLLFFDEYFLMQLFAITGIRYIWKSDE